MNLGEMISQVNADIDDSVSTTDIKNWINRAIDDISPIAKKKERKTTPIVSTNVYEIPDDCREIKYIFINGKKFDRLPEDDRDSTGYRLWGKEFIVQNGPTSGEIEIYYYRKLQRLENDVDEPEIEPEYHDLFILYAVAMSQFMDDEPQRQNDAMSRYLVRKQEYSIYSTRNNRVKKVSVKVGWS